MEHRLSCKCGVVQGIVSHPEQANRGVCYCRDCQAYAHVLGSPDRILDAHGGSDVIATMQQNVTFHQGIDSLACISLTENGLLRWHTSCCRTPIGNTPRTRQGSFIGLLHNCLENGACTIDFSFGTVRMHVYTKHAKGKVASRRFSALASSIRFLVAVVKTRIGGSYKRSPFFSAESGDPIVAPTVLSAVELEKAMSSI